LQSSMIYSSNFGYIEFGNAVDVSSNQIVIGAHSENNNAGKAYIYEYSDINGGEILFIKEISSSNSSPDDYFGHAVAIDDDSVVAGAVGVNGVGNYVGSTLDDTGAVYVFEPTHSISGTVSGLGSNDWVELTLNNTEITIVNSIFTNSFLFNTEFTTGELFEINVTNQSDISKTCTISGGGIYFGTGEMPNYTIEDILIECL